LHPLLLWRSRPTPTYKTFSSSSVSSTSSIQIRSRRRRQQQPLRYTAAVECDFHFSEQTDASSAVDLVIAFIFAP
jgi:hypothetical protein